MSNLLAHTFPFIFFVKLLMLGFCLHDWLPLARLSSVFLAHPEDHCGLEVVSLRPAKTLRAAVQSSRDRDLSLGRCPLGQGGLAKGELASHNQSEESLWKKLRLRGSAAFEWVLLSQHGKV
ncbi:hypothetical protein CesoFtcFv8_027121 [Champsocephalus esox]|uniref:Uncharacterized protein n=2 Tax=Champsocephalus esox TaxID=159716 RepID=A0AAN8B117_9TELE|nr:hypothetical protein CesoFtcFv8_027121 [Champsocephalus esox]